jgi:hypothetical protein
MGKVTGLLLAITLLSYCATPSTKQDKNNTYDSLQIVLEEVLILDQEGREKGWGWEKIMEADRKNLLIVTAILDQYGWIDSSNIGTKASEALFYVIQHADLEYQEKYYPMFQESVDQGASSMGHYAMMTDRILMRKGKKQRFGTQGSSGNLRQGSAEMLIWPIENPAIVNELRKEVGLELTVEENAARLGAEYDPKEKLPAEY